MENRKRITLRRSWLKFTLQTILSIGFVIIGLNHIETWYGIVVLILGFGAFYEGIELDFTCPYCDRKIVVNIFNEDAICKKCKTFYVIDWERYK